MTDSRTTATETDTIIDPWLDQVVQGSPVPTLIIDASHVIRHWNHALEVVSGVMAADVVGTTESWRPFYPQERPIMADLIVDGVLNEQVETYYAGKCRRSEILSHAWEAQDYFPQFATGGKWLAFTAAPLMDRQGRIIGAIETLQDITEQKDYQLRLEHQATHDALTGLANRSLLHDRIEQALAHASRQARLMALLFIDLDNFKVINDTLGHATGDVLVKEMAQRIKNTTRAGDTVARIGGDEFVVLLYAPETEGVVADIMDRLLADIVKPVIVDGNSLTVGCSIGAALYPRDGTDASTLMSNADTAMYQAKEAGRGGFSFFAQEMNEQVNHRLSLERDLRQAVQNNELELFFQPQVSLGSGRIIGAEALLRWNHPHLGRLLPATFIRLAEETGLIVPIGQWVMQKALSEMQLWAPLVETPLTLALNLSPRQFRKKSLLNEVTQLVQGIGENHIQLELELTESMVMDHPEQAAQIMTDLKGLGVRLSMDDFGTGYSSLAYLRSFPFDIIKIDRSFVSALGTGQGAEAIVRAIIGLADSFGVGIIAEGVETQEQCVILASEGCLMAQGFFYGKPMPGAQFRDLLKARPTLYTTTVWHGGGL